MKKTRRARSSVRTSSAMAALELEASSIAGTRRKQGAESRTRLAAAASPEATGKLWKIPDLKRVDTEQLFRIALSDACGNTDPLQMSILWRDGDDELLLHVSQARLATSTRLIVIAIPVFTDQSGEAEVVVPFVTNTAADPVGLIAATEARPRGPAAVVDVFGEALVAAAWTALVNTTAAWASAAGQRVSGVALVPAGLSATKSALRVSAQLPPGKERR